MLKHKLVDFIIQFMEEVDKEISEMKLFVSLGSCKSSSQEDLPMSSPCRYIDLIVGIAECTSKIRCRIVPDAGMFPCTIYICQANM